MKIVRRMQCNAVHNALLKDFLGPPLEVLAARHPRA